MSKSTILTPTVVTVVTERRSEPARPTVVTVVTERRSEPARPTVVTVVLNKPVPKSDALSRCGGMRGGRHEQTD
jgi:hypothetical protein